MAKDCARYQLILSIRDGHEKVLTSHRIDNGAAKRWARREWWWFAGQHPDEHIQLSLYWFTPWDNAALKIGSLFAHASEVKPVWRDLE